MIQAEHSKIINKIAKEKFKATGVIQKGKSRTWIDDNGWFTTIIEFQPYNGMKGTTLNIGVNFNWYENDFFSFDIGYRQDVEFANFDENSEIQFKENVEKFCDICLEKIFYYRAKLKTINLAKDYILEQYFASENLWGNYNKGVIHGLNGDFELLNMHFDKLLKTEQPFDWVEELKINTVNLRSKTYNIEMFKNALTQIIQNARKSKKLKEMQIVLN